MRRNAIYLLVTLLVVGATLYAFAHEGETHKDIGAERIRFETGIMPPVIFPHRMHQEELGDCNLCHDLFPKKAGAIRTMVDQEKLRRKQVMNGKCIKCHKQKKSAGEAAGPTSCKHCHIRIKK